jgi:hypothetical protein
MEEVSSTLLNSALNSGAWSTLHIKCFIPMKGRRYPCHKGLGGSQSQARHFWRCENILPLPGFEPRICTARSLVTVMNTLRRHPINSYKTWTTIMNERPRKAIHENIQEHFHYKTKKQAICGKIQGNYHWLKLSLTVWNLENFMSSIYAAQSIPTDLKKWRNNHSDAISAEVEYLNFCNSDETPSKPMDSDSSSWAHKMILGDKRYKF